MAHPHHRESDPRVPAALAFLCMIAFLALGAVLLAAWLR